MAIASPSSIVDHAQHGDLGHAAHAVEGGLLAVDQAFVGHVLEQRLERDLLLALEPEGLGDLALAGGASDDWMNSRICSREGRPGVGRGIAAMWAAATLQLCPSQ